MAQLLVTVLHVLSLLVFQLLHQDGDENLILSYLPVAVALQKDPVDQLPLSLETPPHLHLLGVGSDPARLNWSSSCMRFPWRAEGG